VSTLLFLCENLVGQKKKKGMNGLNTNYKSKPPPPPFPSRQMKKGKKNKFFFKSREMRVGDGVEVKRKKEKNKKIPKSSRQRAFLGVTSFFFFLIPFVGTPNRYSKAILTCSLTSGEYGSLNTNTYSQRFLWEQGKRSKT
jgi:hypothetical protein